MTLPANSSDLNPIENLDNFMIDNCFGDNEAIFQDDNAKGIKV